MPTYDGTSYMRVGENRPVFCTIDDSTDGGTVTITSGTFTLYNPAGTVVLGPVSITGFDTPSSAPKAYYTLNTNSFTPGPDYIGEFNILATYSDAVTRSAVIPSIVIHISPKVEASYDQTQLLTVPLYQMRLHMVDTDIENATWSDSELLYFLSIAGNSQWAAIKALYTEVTDKAKMAFRLQLGNLGDDESEVHSALLAIIKALEAQAPPAFAPQVDPPDQKFIMQKGNTTGNMLIWSVFLMGVLIPVVQMFSAVRGL